ncbi:MAG: DUF5060 domain-containing protein [Cyclobacteriaceae bacterium]|nr:DUF5060 domain-containing protein [Cyclobacteriaceae bacterium]
MQTLKMNRIIFILIVSAVLLAGCNQQNDGQRIEQWDVYEIMLEGPSSGNPYMEVELKAIFKNGDEKISVPGFYDGEGIYRIRFSPHGQGTWTYLTESNQAELSGKKGRFHCIPPTGDNHGPVKILNTYYLHYADGSPFYAVGTTAYQWTSVKQSVQARTLETLAKAPFNKIRMCVFPKSYIYGNETDPWMYPFNREGAENDLTQPNYKFFQNFDERVEQLLKMGIQADVILFHPYDAWGYSEMGKEMNEKYVRNMIARLSAYRNVWWSLANEWDVPEIKEAIDWEGIGTLLQKEDPHQRLRGIHNWYDSEDHFYDHSRPWITHISAQTSQFYNAIKWRTQYKKPLLFDEMRYEGDVPSGWGNLTGQEMTSYFWMAGLSGGYGTHGDTFQNNADDSTEVRWWAKGGNLVGESPERIRFFRSVMEKAPVIEMTPEMIGNGDPKNLNTNKYILSKPGEYYLAYVAGADQTIEINLAGDVGYKMEAIDTWNMQIVGKASVEPGLFRYQTGSPYTLVRLYEDKSTN